MNRTYYLHDDTVKTVIALLRDEARRADKLGEYNEAEDLKAVLGSFEAQCPATMGMKVPPAVEDE